MKEEDGISLSFETREYTQVEKSSCVFFCPETCSLHFPQAYVDFYD